ncbi:hypothetical protein SDC9_127612 [bioreactor metagenome]|uniref:Uncharacterized protein n=1 Tax=bioreactor metagenome TaxID=1076179 RepID=A0A645CUI7_9ZZZZ
MEKMGAVTAAYSEQVSAENFAERYSRMLVRYSELKAVCDRYARTQEETKPSFFDRFRSAQSKKDDAQRLTQIEQIGQIAIQDMSVIRTYGVRMAKSTKGISWKELFVSQGRLERINQSYAEKAKAEGAGAEKASFSDQIRQAYLRRHPEEREDTGRPATVESLAGELKELRGKFSALQELLDKLMKPGEKSGGKVEEPSGETSPQPLQPSVEPSLDAPKTGPVTPTQGVVQ